MLLRRRTVLLTGLMTVLAGAAFALTPEPGPPIGQTVGNPRPHITDPDARRKATEERFGDFLSEAFEKGLLKARQDHLERSSRNRK
jgi:hypothetical protein